MPTLERTAMGSKQVIFLLLAALVTFIAAYGYVLFLGTGWRAAFVVFVGSFLFAIAAFFLGDLRKFLLFFLIFAIPLQFGYHILYRPLLDVESQPFASGIVIDTMDVMLILLYAHWILMSSMAKGLGPKFTFGGRLGLVFLGWIAYVFVVSAFTALRFEYSVYEVITYLKGYFLYLYLVNNVRTLEDFRIVIYSTFAGAVAHSLYIAAQFVLRSNYTLHGELTTYMGPEGFRSVGFFGSPDAASVLLSLVFPVLAAYFIVATNVRSRRWAGLCLALIVLAIAFTKVRAAGFALLVSTSLVTLLSYYRGWITLRVVGKALLSALLVIGLAAPFILMRFERGTWGEDRIPLLETAWNMIKANWLWGVGVNNYPMDFMKFVPVKLRHTWEYTVHNEYLLRWAETGLIGAILYYSIIILALTGLYRGTRSTNAWIYSVSVGLFAALIGSLPHRILSFYHYVNVFWFTCVILALVYFVENAGREEVRGRISYTAPATPAANGT